MEVTNDFSQHQEQNQPFWKMGIGSFFTVLFVKLFFPKAIPFEIFEFWKINGDTFHGVLAAWPIFVWALVLCLIKEWLNWDEKYFFSPKEIIIEGLKTNILVGFIEEICFRWTIFLASICTVKLINFFFFGFLGLGIVKFFYVWVLGPIANLTTLKYLQDVLFHHSGWAVGAAIISTNAFFRDGHRYQGLFGRVNSWFCGMFFFWLLFKFGLITCILVHILYDFLFDLSFALTVCIKSFLSKK